MGEGDDDNIYDSSSNSEYSPNKTPNKKQKTKKLNNNNNNKQIEIKKRRNDNDNYLGEEVVVKKKKVDKKMTEDLNNNNNNNNNNKKKKKKNNTDFDINTITLHTMKFLMEAAKKLEDDFGAQLIGHIAAIYSELKVNCTRYPTLEASHRELETSYRELEKSYRELETSHRELKTSFRELETSHRELETSHRELETSFRELETSHRELESSSKEGHLLPNPVMGKNKKKKKEEEEKEEEEEEKKKKNGGGDVHDDDDEEKHPTDSILLTELEKISSRGSLRNRIEHNSLKSEYYLKLYNFEFHPFKVTGDIHWYIKLRELFEFLDFFYNEDSKKYKKLNKEILNKKIPTKYVLSESDLLKLSEFCKKFE